VVITKGPCRPRLPAQWARPMGKPPYIGSLTSSVVLTSSLLPKLFHSHTPFGQKLKPSTENRPRVVCRKVFCTFTRDRFHEHLPPIYSPPTPGLYARTCAETWANIRNADTCKFNLWLFTACDFSAHSSGITQIRNQCGICNRSPSDG